MTRSFAYSAPTCARCGSPAVCQYKHEWICVSCIEQVLPPEREYEHEDRLEKEERRWERLSE